MSGARINYDIELVAGDPRICDYTGGAAQRITLERPRDGGLCRGLQGCFGKRDGAVWPAEGGTRHQ